MGYTYETYVNDTEDATIDAVGGAQANPYSGQYALGTEYPEDTENLGDIVYLETPQAIVIEGLPIGADTTATTRGQSFVFRGTAFYDNVILKVGVRLCKVGTPTDGLRVSLYSANGAGKIDSLLQHSDNSFEDGDLTTSLADKIFNFTTPSVSLDNKYWLLFNRTNSIDAANYFCLEDGGDQWSLGDEWSLDDKWG